MDLLLALVTFTLLPSLTAVILFSFSLDINECSEDPDVCGLGTCSNEDGAFYECICQDGATATGSGGSLTCTGRICP